MLPSSISYLVTLALVLSAAASPVVTRQNDLKAAAKGKATGGAAKGKTTGSASKGTKATTGAKGTKGTGTGTGATAAPADAKGLQSSTTVDPSVIQNTDNGQNPPVTGQSPAATSPNNFANFCATGLPKVPITNGLQITTGSCNPTPIGNIPSINNMPSSKFQSPKNLDTILSRETFNVTLKAQGIELGTFTNAAKTYFANPQTLDSKGQIIGHTHIVMEAIPSLTSTAVTNRQDFVFFKGVDDRQDAQGNVQVEVTGGVQSGFYRMCTIVSSATHQPAIVPVAQHGSLDDCVYFTADPGFAAAAGGNAAGTGATGAQTKGKTGTGKTTGAAKTTKKAAAAKPTAKAPAAKTAGKATAAK
ncbi:hypothetical protein C8R45DRAFT_1137365 [Mycena sanguinolenta]|nr:hypothetical protein C8R45DRAFT_1137365 [Mycena sanguinolenta]